MNINTDIKLITILGPTATGKTNLAVQLAHCINSEIISADSRQIYKNMDIGTGKDLDEYSVKGLQIPYHLIDILDPNEDYSVYTFQKQFHSIYNDILKQKKCPILCGGTGLYIESVLLNYEISSIKPDYDLRHKLDSLSKEELLIIFKELDFDTYNNWKCDTKQRIIRGIEIVSKGNLRNDIVKYNLSLDDVVVLGMHMERSLIRAKITDRLTCRLKNGMVEEVESLLSRGIVTFDRLEYFGLEYKYIGMYLKDEISYEQMFSQLNTAIHKFAKKQMTFFRRMEKRGVKINWIDNYELDNVLMILNSK